MITVRPCSIARMASFRVPRQSPPSIPESPTAFTPARRSRSTMLLFTRPQ